MSSALRLRGCPDSAEFTRYQARTKLTDGSRAVLRGLSLDQREQMFLHFASWRLVYQLNGVLAIIAPFPRLAAHLPDGVRLVKVSAVGRPLPRGWAIPVEADEVAFLFEHLNIEEGEHVLALVVRRDRLPTVQLDAAARERIASALADALLREIQP